MSARVRISALAVALGVTLASRASQARGCWEVSEVIGYQHCSPGFGSGWAVSPWNFDVDVGYARDVYVHHNRTVAVDAATASPFDTSDARFVGNGANLHVGIALGAHLYLPLAMTVTYGTFNFDGGATHGGQLFTMGSGLGYAIPLGIVRVRTELDLGFRSAAFQAKCANDCVTTLSLEPIVAVDVLTGTRTYVSVFAGVEPFGPTSLEVGLRVGTSTRPGGP